MKKKKVGQLKESVQTLTLENLERMFGKVLMEVNDIKNSFKRHSGGIYNSQLKPKFDRIKKAKLKALSIFSDNLDILEVIQTQKRYKALENEITNTDEGFMQYKKVQENRKWTNELNRKNLHALGKESPRLVNQVKNNLGRQNVEEGVRLRTGSR